MSTNKQDFENFIRGSAEYKHLINHHGAQLFSKDPLGFYTAGHVRLAYEVWVELEKLLNLANMAYQELLDREQPYGY